MTISKLEPYLHYKLAQLGRESWLQGKPCLINTIIKMKKLSLTCDLLALWFVYCCPDDHDDHDDHHEH